MWSLKGQCKGADWLSEKTHNLFVQRSTCEVRRSTLAKVKAQTIGTNLNYIYIYIFQKFELVLFVGMSDPLSTGQVCA